MAAVKNKTFQNEVVPVDGKQFRDCVFNNATLEFAGGELPTFTDCRFNDVKLQFQDAAANTLKLLGGLRNGGFSTAIDEILESVRE